MNQEQHKARAESLIDRAEDLDGMVWALVHAVLATIPDPVEAGPRSFQLPDGWCACLRLAYQHRVTPLCDTTPMPPPAPRRSRSPECQETDYDTRGDCDGRVVEVEQVETRYGMVKGSRLFLCRSHRTQAIERGAVRAFHPSQISDGPGS